MARHWVPIDRTSLKRRIGLLGLVTLAWACGMGYRLVDLQVMRAEEMRGRARLQQEQIISLDARRGMFYDRSGRELAVSIEVDSIYAVPAEIDDPARTAAVLVRILEPDAGRRPAAARALAGRLRGDRPFVWVCRKVEPHIRARIEERIETLGLEGIHFLREHRRYYPHGSLAAHVMGWVGMDNEGMEGLELALDDTVRGRNGQMFVLRDARGKHFLRAPREAAEPGHSVVLTIDETIQHIAERELRRAVDDAGARAGSVIVVDPSSGDILAMANEPTFNPNRPTAVAAVRRKNRSVVDAYEPGSTFKVVTLAAALERGRTDPFEIIDCENGSVRVARSRIRDHKPFGRLSVAEILEQSSNVGAIKIGLRLRPQELYDTIRRFGVGTRTGVQLPGESRGLLRPPEEWSGVSQASLSFGQELSVTPLQMVMAISAIASGGVLRTPRIVLRELDPEGAVVAEKPAPPGTRIISERTARMLGRMMRGVVENGTAKAARIAGYTVAGKTGTAQKIGPEGSYSRDRHVASFAGYVPASRPALVILIVLDEPKGPQYHGGEIAAPAFRRIAEPVLRYLRIPPDGLGTAGEAGNHQLTTASLAGRRDRRPRGTAPDRSRQGWEEAREERARMPLPPPQEIVSEGRVALPDLRGHTLRRAVTYLARLGLTPRIAAAEGRGRNLIVAQRPAAGTLLGQGMDVEIRTGPVSSLTRPGRNETEVRDLRAIASMR